PKVLIGKDTRRSGYMVENALTAGFISMGWEVNLLGPLPTPAVSFLTKSLRADLGIMISASHNPYEDNGIKFFDNDGLKIDTKIEEEISNQMGSKSQLVVPSELGRASRINDVLGRYTEFAKISIPASLTLNGMKIVADCANGAAYKILPQILSELGAEVVSIAVNPDGFNINEECGSTKPEKAQKAVLKNWCRYRNLSGWGR
ncbi:phosphoglucosamine mutase, partial [Paracoccaceae bacterium]|nr:phosphoglucosamine mutase [Paracoccaceae bacterium]